MMRPSKMTRAAGSEREENHMRACSAPRRAGAGWILATALLAACSGGLPGSIDAPKRTAAASAENPLQLTSTQALGERLIELTFTTTALDGETRVRVLLPQGYDEDPARRYPVLYLYHGSFDDEKAWTEKGDAEALTENYPFIVVMPDAGSGGYYSDWYNFGAGGPPMWETYHITQLLPWIDTNFRTLGTREARATLGLSMGGFGAVAYAAKHPDLFVSAASLSGALDTNVPADLGQPDQSVLDGGMPMSTWGVRVSEELRWRQQNPWDLAENLRGLHLVIRTGNGLPGEGYSGVDPIEILLHKESTNFHDKLDALGIAHLWDDYGPGGHSWDYWQRGLRDTLPLIAETFAAPPAPPLPFSFIAAAPEYEVYGWRVSLERPALEFSRLEVDEQGFALSGSGRARVLTPPGYVSGKIYRVEGALAPEAQADDEGRLGIEVDLGAGNPFQQYTPQARALGTQSVTARVRILRD